MKWQEIINGLSSQKPYVLETKYLTGQGEVLDCRVKLIPFILDEEKRFQYIILSSQEQTIKVEKGQALEALVNQDTQVNYDNISPNPVMYFNEVGNISYVNEKMKILNDPQKDKTSVEDLFLESELGPLIEGLKKYPTKDKQVMVRMIMKAKSKIIEGYARISFHFEDNMPDVYRVEFVPLEGIQLVDQSIEKVLDELEKLRSEVERTKSTLLNEQLTTFSPLNVK